MKNMTAEQMIKKLVEERDLALKQLASIGVGLGDNMDHVKKALEQRWIPCSERMPEAGKKVIVWYEGEYWDNQEKFSACTIARYREKHGDWSGEFYPDALDVIAWMPLPEPYKGGE